MNSQARPRLYRCDVSWLKLMISFSAILNIYQEGEPWPLYIKDHAGAGHVITLSPGDMLWYESAKLAHARPVRFTGHHYDNVFVHYKPRSRKWYGQQIMQVTVILHLDISSIICNIVAIASHITISLVSLNHCSL